MTTSQSQEYELAFVTALPQGVTVVDPSTLDFARNPAGSLAFRYKHGWILINPLIPSRGRSGGGLAKAHGHKSGGFTAGHFIKGADGKMKFKAHTNYGDKAEWENEVKQKAAGVKAKQEAAKAAVQQAEYTTNKAAQLESEGAPKATQAAAHAAAAQAHQDAVKHFQGMGKDGLKPAILTHSAHSAIHASKASKLEQQTKNDSAARLESEKALAHSKAVHEATTGSYAKQAEVNAKAVEAHKSAAAAHKAAGNTGKAKMHDEAAAQYALKAKHAQEGVADSEKKQAHYASEAVKTEQQIKDAAHPSLKASLHKSAATEYQKASEWAAKAGKDAEAARHAQKAEKHLQAAQKEDKTAKLEQRKKLATGLTTKANDLSAGTQTVDGPPKAKAEAHIKAAEAHKAAQQANETAGNTFTAQAHAKAAEKHEHLAAKQAEAQQSFEKTAATGTAKAETASKSAKIAGEEGDSLASQIAAHEHAAKAHGEAASAHDNLLGDKETAQNHLTKKSEHLATVANLKAQKVKQEAAEAEAAKLGKAAQEASAKAAALGDDDAAAQAHMDAAKAFLKAKVAAKAAGLTDDAQDYSDNITAHQNASVKVSNKIAAKKKAQAEANEIASGATQDAKYVAENWGETEKAAKGYKQISEQYHKAAQKAKEAGNAFDAEDHEANAKAYAAKAEQVAAKASKATAAKAAAQKAEAASKAADAAGTGPDAVAKHQAATLAHMDAAEAAKAAGLDSDASAHYAQSAEHANAITVLKKNAVKNKAQQDAGDIFNQAGDAEDAGDPAKALDLYKKAAQLAEQGGNVPLQAAALHAAALVSDNPEDHQAAIKALQKAWDLETAKAAPNKHIQAKYKNQITQHQGYLPTTDTASPAETLQKGSDALKAGNKEEAIQHFKDAAAQAESAGDVPMHVSALHNLAMASDSMSDHQEAIKAAAKAWTAEGKKDSPSAFYQGMYTDLMDQHGDAIKTLTTGKIKPVPSASGASDSSKPLKPVGKLTGTGKKLGTHGSEVMEDEAGNKWLNKSDAQGYARALDPAVAALHRKAGLPTPVFVKTKDGHLQGMVPGSKDAFPNGNFNPESLSEADVAKMLQHQVMDYVTGNQDSHSGQWLQTPDGLMQIDQGQAFKFGVGNDPTKTYPPLGSDVPVYPKLWNAAKAGKISIPDPSGDNDFAKTIQAVQNMPDEEFKAMFKPYAVQAFKNGHKPGGHATVDAFLDDIVQHKNKIGADFQKLYDGLPESAKAGSSAAKTAQQTKAAALKTVQENSAAGKPLNADQIKAAKAAGASLLEIDKAHQDGKTVSESGLTPLEKALQKVAEHELSTNTGWSHKQSKKLEEEAKALGATPAQVAQAFDHPDKVLKTLTEKANETKKTPSAPVSTAPSKLSAKDAALKAYAEHSLEEGEGWSAEKHKELKAAAKAAGASYDELHKALYESQDFLDGLNKKPSSAPTAPTASTAPAKPKTDPFKPKAKWSKVITGVKVDGEIQQVAAVAGPKQMVVHKSVSGTPKGWTISSADGLKLGENLKTQKEAKLAAEWMAKQLGPNVSKLDTESFKKWTQDNPDAAKKLKQDWQASAWNTEAQAELDGADGATVSAPATNATAAAPVEPKLTFGGLTNNKGDNALLLKALYDQAHGPNATAADMEEYEKAQKAWALKHSTGPFDPSKFQAPAAPGAPVDMSAKTKQWFPTSHAAGFTAVPANQSLHGDWKPTPEQAKGPLMFSSNSGYSGMGDQLRGEKIWGTSPASGQHTVIGTKPAIGPTGGQWDDYIASTDAAFQAVPPLDQDIVVSRKFDGYLPFDDYPPPMQPGAEYRDKGYNSTSKSADTWSGNFHLEIQIPKGRKVLDLNHTSGSHFESELEVLINREATYRVISDTKVGGTRKVIVMLMDDGVAS